MDTSIEIRWQGKPLDELTREELMEAVLDFGFECARLRLQLRARDKKNIAPFAPPKTGA